MLNFMPTVYITNHLAYYEICRAKIDKRGIKLTNKHPANSSVLVDFGKSHFWGIDYKQQA